jgi:hypothetical protein
VASPVAKSLLEDAGTPAVALMRAATAALGEFLAWEPESIWLELHRQDLNLPEENRAKIMAALTLRLIPSFYWDALVFEKTALAFDGVMPSPDILEEASPARLAWAVVEAAMIIKEAREASWEFQHEPRAYAAVVLNRAGFVLAPEQLAFAQMWLDRERRHDHLLEDTRARWARVAKDHLEQLTLEETPEDVQIARLAAVELHVRERRAAVERALARLA